MSGLRFVFLVPPIGKARIATIKRMKKAAKDDRAIAKARFAARATIEASSMTRSLAWTTRIIAEAAKAKIATKAAAKARQAARALNRVRVARKASRRAARAAATQAALDRMWDAMFVPFYG